MSFLFALFFFKLTISQTILNNGEWTDDFECHSSIGTHGWSFCPIVNGTVMCVIILHIYCNVNL